MNRTKFFKNSIISISVVALLSGCANKMQNTDNEKTKQGALIGAVAGAVLAAATGEGNRAKRAAIGAAAGAAVGGAIGYNMDKQAKEIAKSLDTNVSTSVEAEKDKDLDIVITQTKSYVKVTFRDKMMFETNSATPTPTAKFKISKLINVLKNYPQSIIQIVGHTDNRGDHKYNQTLSENRAASVADLIVSSGVKNKIYANGCSYDKAIVPNDSEENMALNRRVEIFLYPNADSVQNQCL